MASISEDWANVESDDSVGAIEPEEQIPEPEQAEAESSDEEDDGFDMSQLKGPAAEKVEEKAAAPVKKLTKKEKNELKKKELDDLDDVFAEFGIDTSAAPAPAKVEEKVESTEAVASDDKKKRKKKKAAKKPEPKAAAPDDGVKLTPEQVSARGGSS